MSETNVSDSSAFLDAIADLDYTFTRDRRAARRRFDDALALAKPADREFLDDLVETFTRYPYETALRRLDAQWAHDESQHARLLRLVPDTDPGLYVRDRADRIAALERQARRNGTSVDDEAFAQHAQLPAAELPRQSIRMWRNPPGRTYLAPSRETDKSRMSPDRIRARVQGRGKRRPAVSEPKIVGTYVAENLYVDTAARELADARAREEHLRAEGLLPTPEPGQWIRRWPGDTPPADADESREIWDCQLVGYVAEQHIRAAALAGKRPVPEERALAYADKRTQLRGDRRPEMPVGGNGLDYDTEAMTPVSGWRCVSCFIERPTTDQRALHTRDGHVRSDDGLCDHCRADDRPGLPELPAGFGASDLAHAYCQFLADTYPTSARAILAEARRRAPRWLTELIDQFASQADLPGATPATDTPDVDTEQPPARPRRRQGPLLGAGQRQARCEGCTRIRAIHDDGFCTECRVWLGLVTAAPRQPTAA
ncbi:hypothetical protein [Nocardia mexicana]|uniref:Uncharacterized protein n=1 Tax=Nocardia mexicana TaxID=279262 RepID=A0A370GPT8_9NOCA|nr:hypothetical protein [Nocardia mexicana]RDI45320.1 hypothetical protein DFR68_11390 [Nocardia mexicana]